MPYSFKLLVHDIKISIQDPILIQNPSISVAFANYPKMIVKGKCPISNVKRTNDQQQAFGNGKSVLLHLDQDRLTDILREQPLELLLLNEQTIIAGARIRISHFIPDIDKELKFKRGNFHLLDPLGKPYALVDISISIHDSEKIPEVLKAQQEQQIQNEKLKHQQQYVQSLEKPSDPEPAPDEIVYQKNKQQKPIKQQLLQSPNLQQQQVISYKQEQEVKLRQKQEKPNSAILQKQQPPLAQQSKRPISAKVKQQQQFSYENEQRDSIKESANVSMQQKKKSAIKINQKYVGSLPYKQKNKFDSAAKNTQLRERANPNSVMVPEPEEILDIPIADWVNTLYCPPPMFLDKKIYVHKIYNSPEDQVEKYVKPSKTQSVAIQTEFYFQPTNQAILEVNTYQEHVQTPNERMQTQTVVSDNYQEDFESFVQSQSLANQSQPKSRTPRALPSTNRRTHSIQEAIDEDVISDIYSDDFEQISQSQTFKRSLSKKDEISESYIPDFESMSQSQQFKKR